MSILIHMSIVSIHIFDALGFYGLMIMGNVTLEICNQTKITLYEYL